MSHRLKMKIGVHEFDAEGPQEYVDAKFEQFQALIEKFSAPQAAATTPVIPQTQEGIPPAIPAVVPPPPLATGGVDLSQIFTIDADNKRLNLHVHIDDADGKNQQAGDAMLIVLYGYRKQFQVDELGAVQMSAVVKNAIGQTARPDLAAPTLVTGGYMTRNGTGRSTTYRITPKGMARAEAAIKATLAKMGA